jgi:hypothetical protein
MVLHRPIELARITGQLPSLAGNVVAGTEIRGSGRIVGNPFPYRIMEGLPVIQERYGNANESRTCQLSTSVFFNH